MADKHILVTGGFGFLGSHLVERLLTDEDARVHVVDNLSTSPINHEAYVRRVANPRLSHDILSVEQYHARGNFPTFQEIYHLASPVGPVGVLQHAGKITKSITDDTYRVLEIAQLTGARLCDVSTSEIYGGGRDGYCSENDAKIITPKVSVRLEYAVAKLACEIALVNTVKVSDLFAVIIRPFNIAGPRQSGKGGFVLPRFIQQCLKNEPLTVYGDGKMIRAFTHVVDVADGIVRALRRGRRGEAYNIGNPANKISILDLAQRTVRIAESQSRIDLVDPKQLFGPLFEEANDKFPDSDKATNELGWHPRFDLDTVVRDTVEYIRAGRVD
jgi:nucleoside-diphosphate-sugar epimerase